MTRETKHQLARVALRSARSVKSVPAKTARDLRDLSAVVETIDPLKGEREGAITLNVLNVAGDLACG